MKMSKLTRRMALSAGLSLLSLLAVNAPALADGFPERQVTLVVPFAAGGSTDVVARIIAQKMSEDLGQQVIVQNVAGAGGNLGADNVARADADGYTILMGTVATHALNPLILKSTPYDAEKDFAPISLLVVVPNVLVVNPALPAKNVEELLALLKGAPDQYSYASSGNGTPLHLSGELFKSMAGVEMVHIPYKGAGPALNDVIANQVPIMFDNLPSSSGHIKAGTLRALAVTTKERAASFPDVPTVAESGIPGYETYTWNALFAPAGTPPEVIARLNQSANTALKDPAVAERMKEFSATIVGSTPEELGAHVKAEIAKWTPVVRDAKVQMD
ncbi:tripartite tricarboxylate transporter substrate binding protein [Shinella sp. AETb1-6]|uniref:Tripartite tricarboxylate transporter substrate binding protein n=1 Tax=Shinella oryzae TaxID=2871820 RepID=A0ABY9KDS0_9HYPH|nr:MULTISPECIES: tripartite tricarboxylate transporter substrate binding protein [Shinella]MCD1262310.1 tripartite tricarboxylate transporter substrate binding protein [Shinella sumterensis]MXN53461.1 tripartite tricarboxylate transporter substrate binding protein [Shinella sp. AETb1-6]TFE97115.1 ABC transporter substrate-binding protein [Shinella sumterensis]WLS05809.1 tripartite tricarboxylate transporter substrate binding protein [Shinella oryzae]WLS11050.1 tripartite tricarboxylate transpo